MNSKTSQTKIIKPDLNNYTSSLCSSKYISYAAAVTDAYSNSMTRLSTLTNKFKEILNNKSIPQGHLDSAATSMFLANKHKHLGKELHHEEINVGVINTYTMSLVTTRQL